MCIYIQNRPFTEKSYKKPGVLNGNQVNIGPNYNEKKMNWINIDIDICLVCLVYKNKYFKTCLVLKRINKDLFAKKR